MKPYFQRALLTIALACSVCLSGFVFGQNFSGRNFPGQGARGYSKTISLGFGTVRGTQVQNDDDRYGTYPRPGVVAQQRGGSSVSGSRSVSFKKDGKRVSIAENASGISVTVDGKRFRAKDPAELKRKHPDAYRLYDEHIGAAQSSATARGSARASAGSSAGENGLPMRSNTLSTRNLNISVMENGQKVSITEDKKGITVSSNGKRVRAKNVAELEEKSPGAFRIYEKHVGKNDWHATQPDATALLREELSNLRNENASNPQLRSLIDRMIRNAAQ